MDSFKESEMNRYLQLAIGHIAQAQAGADLFSETMRERAREKWEKSKQLPRKQKKLMRKDALMDLTLAQWSDETADRLFNW